MVRTFISVRRRVLPGSVADDVMDLGDDTDAKDVREREPRSCRVDQRERDRETDLGPQSESVQPRVVFLECFREFASFALQKENENDPGKDKKKNGKKSVSFRMGTREV